MSRSGHAAPSLVDLKAMQALAGMPFVTAPAPEKPTPLRARWIYAWPFTEGWWWCRAKEGWQPGDEMCVEVMIPTAVNGFSITWNGEPYYADDERFQNMEWLPAQSPWLHLAYQRKHTTDEGHCSCAVATIAKDWPRECQTCGKVLEGYPIPDNMPKPQHGPLDKTKPHDNAHSDQHGIRPYRPPESP